MAKNDVIRADIRHQIDLLFNEIKSLVKSSGSEKKNIDDEIKILWEDFRQGLDYFFQKKKLLTQLSQKPLILYSESYFIECCVKYEQKHSQGYHIKLRPKTHFPEPLPREILSTESRLQHGRKHVQIAEFLRVHWQSSSLNLSSADLILGNLYLSLIYYSGCHHLQHLVAVGNHLFKYQQGADIQVCKLYHSEYKSITNPLVLTYKVQHPYYGNEVDNKIIYQWRQIWINPYAVFLWQALSLIKPINAEQKTRDVLNVMMAVLHQLNEKKGAPQVLQQVLYDLKNLTQVRDEILADVGLISAFKHMHLGLEFDPKLNLDMTLSQVLQQNLKTVALSSLDQKYSWLEQDLQHSEWRYDINRIALQIQVETVGEFRTATENLKSIPFELALFEKYESSTFSKRQKKQEKIKWLRWSKIQKILEQQRSRAIGKERNIIEAQLRLLAWVFDLKAQNVKVSSLERYLSSIAKDYLFHIYMYEDDIECMTENDYELLYQEILYDIDQRDQAKAVLEKQKNQNRAQYAFGRLKSFHHFCMQHFKAPSVISFKSSQFQRVQICHAKLISPRHWHQFKHLLMLKIEQVTTLQEKRYLQQLMAMYIFAYRLGLRLSEVRGLSLAEVIAPELVWKEITQNIQISIILKNNNYRRLKSKNAQRQLHINSVLLKDEMDYIKAYLKQRIDHITLRNTFADSLVFAENEEILSEHSISELTKLLMNELMGEQHGYTFHSFRHSAANHLAIAWLGSKELVKTYSDYTWQQVKEMRLTLFGAIALQNEGIIQHKWRLLADWMGHGSCA